ncbi:unnamed protein product [Adineta ricciae]|uniref:Uncharacterized protein n=1 Tax=Adineta ricciae TaxID=249248 RepID=A0A815NQU8_ADIRI|nr:unnamed protein product [Adineta ricciae]CAF1498717.1 unnamed protein product [Adineta ricciae]
MFFVIGLSILFAANHVYALDCKIVKQGQHFISTLPFYGFKQDLVLTTRIRFNESMARYLFPSTESKGRSCSLSWNQVWGATRCGYLTSTQMDLDRFVWRRPSSCLQYDSKGYVVNEYDDCPEKNLIELAASAYDNGLKPFEHPGVLLKEFTTKPQINTWYNFKLIFEDTKTTYQLLDESNQLLESQFINHHSCEQFNFGMIHGLYFGGECPAPQDVSVCYDSS